MTSDQEDWDALKAGTLTFEEWLERRNSENLIFRTAPSIPLASEQVH